MSKMAQALDDLLARSSEIDQMPEGQFITRQRWLKEAVELLLRSVRENQS